MGAVVRVLDILYYLLNGPDTKEYDGRKKGVLIQALR